MHKKYSVGIILLLLVMTFPVFAQASFDRQLELGSAGADVQRLQQFLKDGGYLSLAETTTYFGNLTRDAVARFQTSAGLDPVGRVGPLTLAILNGDSVVTAVGRTLQLGASGSDVSGLQQFLKDKGYYAYPEITGYFGSVTEAALRACQAANGLVVSGTADPNFIVLLNQQNPADSTGPVAANPVRRSGSRSRSSGGSSPSPGDTTPPAAPSSLSIDAGDAEADLEWNDPSDPDLSYVSIYRGTVSGSLALLATSSPIAEEYSDSPLSNGVTYYYALTATDANGNESSPTPEESAVPSGAFDIYVDSVGGDDSNDGTSDYEAFQTIAAAQTAANTIGDGVSIGLKRGSVWHEELNLPSVDGATLMAYGTGEDLPVIDGSDAVTGWVRHDAVTYPNVWSASVNHDLSQNTSRLAVYEVTGAIVVPLVAQTSISAVNATSTTRYSPSDGSLTANDPATVYIHTSDGSDPNTNGKTYVATVRDYGLSVGSGTTIKNLRTRFNGNNDGSLRVGGSTVASSDVSNAVVEWGTKHNALIDDGELSDSVLIFQDDTTSSEPANGILGIYANSASGREFTARNVHIIASDNNTSRRSGWSQPMTMHDSGSGVYDTFRWYGGSLRGTSIDGLGGAADAVVDGVFLDRTGRAITSPDTNAGGQTAYVRRAMMRLDLSPSTLMGGVSVARKNLAWEDTVIYAATMQTSDPLLFWNSSYATQFALSGVVYYTPNNTSFIRQSSSVNAGTLATVNRSIFMVPSGAEILGNLTTGQKTGSRNIFIRNVNAAATSTTGIFGDDNINITRANVSTYLAMCGLVTTGSAATDVDLLIDSLFLNGRTGMANGDFRLNPETAACMVFPDGMTVADAGVGAQSHWDHHAGASASGAPSAWPDAPKNLSDALEFVESPDDWEY